MASDAFTSSPKRPGGEAGSLTVEYNLHPEDHLALHLFIYDKAHPPRGRGAAFLVERFSSPEGVFAAFAYALVIRSLVVKNQLPAPVVVVLLTLASGWMLDTLWPGGFFRSFLRGVHRGRMRRLIESGRRTGVFNPKRRDQVVLTEEGFIETNDLRDDVAAGVEINEHKETRVAWSAVASIDVADEHAFFTVTDRGYLILPREGFADSASFLHFVKTAREYREAAGRDRALSTEVPRPQDTRITP